MIRKRIEAIGNIIIEGVLFLNVILLAAGKSPIPLDKNGAVEFISYLAYAIQTLYIWWKNQDMSPEACEGTGLTHMLKDQKRSNYEITEDDEDVEQISEEL